MVRFYPGHLLGLRFEGHTYVEYPPNFWLEMAPKIFTTLANALEWIVKVNGSSTLMVVWVDWDVPVGLLHIHLR